MVGRLPSDDPLLRRKPTGIVGVPNKLDGAFDRIRAGTTEKDMRERRRGERGKPLCEPHRGLGRAPHKAVIIGQGP